MGARPSPSPVCSSVKCQQYYAKSCHLESVFLSRNALFFYGPEYGFLALRAHLVSERWQAQPADHQFLCD